MADMATKNRISALKKQIADAERSGNLQRIDQLKKQLANFEASAIKAGKVDPVNVTTEGKKYKVGQTFTIAPVRSIMNFSSYSGQPEIDESSGFIKFLTKKLKGKYGSKAKAKAEEAWKKAKASHEKSTDYERIAGAAKVIASNMLKSKKKKMEEDGTAAAAPVAATAQTGTTGMTMTSDIKPFAAKLGEKPNYDKPGKYKPNPASIYRRKVKPTKPPKKRKLKEDYSEAYTTDIKSEMIEFLQNKFKGLLDPHEQDANNFDMEAAIYWFANDYHGGQNSDLYSVLSTSEFNPGPNHRSVEDEGETAKEMYDALVDKYEHKKESVNKYVDNLFE